jgi:hypothetical protein
VATDSVAQLHMVCASMQCAIKTPAHAADHGLESWLQPDPSLIVLECSVNMSCMLTTLDKYSQQESVRGSITINTTQISCWVRAVNTTGQVNTCSCQAKPGSQGTQGKLHLCSSTCPHRSL